MKRSTILTSLLAAAALIGTTAATTPEAQARMGGMGQGAQMGGMAGEFDFAEADADKDGKVTEAELRAWRAARTAALDADGDGKISEAELVASSLRAAEARATRRARQMISRLDADGDGALSAAELLAGGQMQGAFFDRIDRDGDGALTEAELTQARDRMMQRRDRASGDQRAERRAERRMERGMERGAEGGHRHKWKERSGRGTASDAPQD
jgi:Ca2+-binding EF-hand superfamily protein